MTALTSTTISIDGDFSDWAGVRSDPDNTSRDSQISDPDPDYPGQSDRDTYLVNTTWDEEFLYIAMRRTAGGTKAITWIAYIDRDGDGLLQNSDVVCLWTTSSGSGRYSTAHTSSPTARILRYNQARYGSGTLLYPDGDPMGHDGETPDGWADKNSGEMVPLDPMDGWLATNGIEFEGRVAWSDLGLEPGSLISVHFASGNGESLGKAYTPSNTRKTTGNPPQSVENDRGHVEDNVNDIWWLRSLGVSLTPNRQGTGIEGETIAYAHTVHNTSNTTETFDLTAVSDLGWNVAITDTEGMPVTSVTLDPGESFPIRVLVSIPEGTPDGTHEITTVTVTATAQSDRTVSASVTDRTTAGRVTISPDHSGSMAPGQTARYVFTITNNQLGGDRVYDVSALGSMGWPTSVKALDGTPLSAVTLAAGESRQIVVEVSVPPTASPGQQDFTRLVATESRRPDVRGQGTATTKVLAGLTIAPSNSGFTGANSAIFYEHTVTNSWSTTRTITLSATSSRGWPVAFFAPDGATQLNTVTLGPNGDSAKVLARVLVPAGTAPNTTDTTTVRATAAGATDATATDTTTVRRLMVYPDGSYTNPTDTYQLTDEVFARATGLTPGDTVFFVWYDMDGMVRTGPDRTVDAQGMQFDSYDSQLADTVSDAWRVELWSRAKNPVLLESFTFRVTDKAEIIQITATDAPGAGSDISISTTVKNFIDKEITDSSVTYLIWWDENGDGTFSVGDTWIDSSGRPTAWDGASPVQTHVTEDIDLAGAVTWSEQAPWTVNNREFPHQGAYRITATWRTSDGTVIDERTTQFFSIPALGWPLFALAFAAALAMLGRRLSIAPRAGAAR